VVLSTHAVHPPPKVNDDIAIRPLETHAEWQAALELEVLCRDEGEEAAGYRTFIERKVAQYTQMITAGIGRWFGAFVDGKIVAHMGLFVEDGIGRFQSVKTHPVYRRRGICGTMVHDVARRGLEEMEAQTLMMIADAEYHAARIYESVGFKPTERIVGIERR
jgi:ribosomal protein S18 acetylase RimI-like enzyme